MLLSTRESLPNEATGPMPTSKGKCVGSRRRWAATALEYLVAISLIFVVVIGTVNYFAQATKSSLEDSGGKIKNAGSNQKPPP